MENYGKLAEIRGIKRKDVFFCVISENCVIGKEIENEKVEKVKEFIK